MHSFKVRKAQEPLETRDAYRRSSLGVWGFDRSTHAHASWGITCAAAGATVRAKKEITHV